MLSFLKSGKKFVIPTFFKMYKKHLELSSLLREMDDKMDDKNEEKGGAFFCEKCQYKTSHKYDFERHISTLKHKRMTNGLQDDVFLCPENFICHCGKIYKYRQGLFKHKNTCKRRKKEEPTAPKFDDFDKSMILELLKQNGDLQKQIIEISSKPTIVTNYTTNTNSNNKQFNLQFFLNETCKNAMNIKDFVDSLEIKSNELEDLGKLGYVQGISNIFIRGLKELDETERPLHCTDKKRETLYIKDINGWEKDSFEKTRVKKIIKDISNKNFKRIPDWKQENPLSEDITSKKHMEYMQILNQVMGSITPEDEQGINKIIRNVVNHVCIDSLVRNK
jgi:hypothetical protein